MNSVERVFDPAPDAADRFTDANTWECGGRLWPSNERQVLTCCRVVNETHDVKSFEFRTGDGLPVRFEPGQFTTVSANVKGQAVDALVDSTRTDNTLSDVRAYRLARKQAQLKKATCPAILLYVAKWAAEPVTRRDPLDVMERRAQDLGRRAPA